MPETVHRSQPTAEELERLRKVSLAITSTLERKPLLELVIREAVGLLQAQSGGLYELDAERRELTVIAEFRRPELLGAKLKVGEGLAGRLVENAARDYVIEPDYAKSEFRLETFLQAQPPIGAFIEVKLRWQGAVLGVLYVDDAVGREFTPEEAELLSLFASHAAIALANSDLMARSQARRERLKDLAAATREIMGDAREKNLDERLDLIARYVAEVTDAQMAGVLLVRHPGILVLEATHGERPGSVAKGRQFKVESGEGTGLTGAIAFAGKLVNLRYEDLFRHPAVRRAEVSASPAKTCYSLLAIPLTRRVGGEEVLFGLLRAENKKGLDGEPRQEVGFTEEDVESIKIFADAVVIALELAERRDWLNRLVDSSPDGIIAIDLRANVTLFNRQAEQILGYTRAEAKAMKVHQLYADEQDPKRIGALLANDELGRVDQYPTAVRSKDGVSIPIRHSSTWLYDSRGERIGSVGYFEDLRKVKLAELRLESLLKATSIVANATDLAAGLGQLTSMMADLVPHTFSRILLMEDEGDYLRVEAVQVAVEGDEERARLKAALQKSMSIRAWPGFLDRLTSEGPSVLSIAAPADLRTLGRLSAWLGLSAPLQTLLLAPLRLEKQVVGLIEFGEVRIAERSVFSRDEIDFVAQIAAHTTALINRMRLLGEAQRRGHQLAALDEASRTMQEQPEPPRLFRELARLAAELVSCRAGALFVNHPRLEEVELVAQYGIPDQRRWLDEGRSQGHHEGVVGEVVSTREMVIRLDWDSGKDRDPVLRDLSLRTTAAVPLRFLGDVDAVLFVGDYTGRQRFAKADREVLRRFADHASIALHVSGLITPEMRSMAHFRLLHKITDFIQHENEPDKIMDAMLTGITAGYGLGFNRAAILLLDRPVAGPQALDDVGVPPHLEGHGAIGHLTKEAAERSWEESRRGGLDDFAVYLDHLREGRIAETPLKREIRRVSFPISAIDPDPLSKAVLEQRWLRLKGPEVDDLPASFARAFSPGSEVVVLPLEARGQVRGLLVADNKFSGAEITPQTIQTLLTFVGTLSISLDNRRLYAGTQASSDRLKRLFALSNKIAARRKAEQILRDLLDDLPVAVDAAWARLILLDRLERLWWNEPGGRIDQVAHISTVRPHGNSMRAMKEGKPVVIEDLSKLRGTDSPFMKERNIPAAICLPLHAHGSALGVLWINYAQPRRFQPFEVEALLLFAGQVAAALDNALRLDELERLRAAVEKISLPTTLEAVLHAVARGAIEIAGGDSAVVWPYDGVRQAFVPTEALLSGVTQQEFGSFVLIDDDGESLAWLVKERGSLAVSDLSVESSEPALEQLRAPLRQAGVGGFQAVALWVDEELVGVLYVNYREAASFGERSLQLLSAFANHAGLAVKNARILDRVSRAKKAAESVAHLTKLEDLNETLKSVAKSACAALRCDSVVVFTYYARDGLWGYPPVSYGVRFPEMAWPENGEAEISRSIVARILDLEEPHFAPDLSTDSLLGGHQFALHEGISACCAWPLEAAGDRVGVMFVNFKVPHLFKSDIRSDIELFADQAVVAIRNRQLLDALQTDQLRALQDFQHQIHGPIFMAGKYVRRFEASHFATDRAFAGTVEVMRGLLERAERVSSNIRLYSWLARKEPIQAECSWLPVSDILGLVRRIAETHRSIVWDESGIDYDLTSDESTETSRAEAFVDLELLDIAINNIVDNAFKYSHSGTTIQVAVAFDGVDEVRVGVRSLGIRVRPGEEERCFEREWQSDEARASGSEGRGIGLWIVGHVMRALFGSARVCPTDREGVTEVRLAVRARRREP